MTTPQKYLSLLALLLSPILCVAQNRQLGLITLGPDGRVVKFAGDMRMEEAAQVRSRDGHERYISKDLNVFFVQISHYACADVLSVNGNRSWIIEQSRRLGISSTDVPMYTTTTECFSTEGAEIDFSGYEAGINGWYTPGGKPTVSEPFRILGKYSADSPDRDLEAWHYIMRLAVDGVARTQQQQAKAKAVRAKDEADISAGRLYTPGKDGVTPPTLTHSIDPKWSQEAIDQQLGGIVVVSLIVNSEGEPEQVAVARGVGHGLDAMAVDTVRQYTFSPATKDGVPVPVRISVEINYHVDRTPSGGR